MSDRDFSLEGLNTPERFERADACALAIEEKIEGIRERHGVSVSVETGQAIGEDLLDLVDEDLGVLDARDADMVRDSVDRNTADRASIIVTFTGEDRAKRDAAKGEVDEIVSQHRGDTSQVPSELPPVVNPATGQSISSNTMIKTYYFE